MKCGNCGADLEEGTLFCPVCGKEVQWVPEYNTLETLIKQRELEEREKKRREMEARKEREKEERKAELERKKKKHKRQVIAGVAGGIIVLGIAAFGFIYQTQINSFDHQMSQAETAYREGDYDSALQYIARARELEPDNPEAEILEARIYVRDNNESAAQSILLSVIQENPDNTTAYGELLRLYEQQGEYTAIRDLMNQASDNMREIYQNYVCSLPEISQEGGSYSEEVTIEISNIPSGTTVYYTLDGSDPDQDSERYEEPVELTEEGTFTFKYIAYNEKSVPSDTGEEEYVISFDAPERPKIAPVSGMYEYQENIIVTAPEGCTVYYAFDETPTVDSTEYTGPVAMPQGEHTFSAIAVDSRGKKSPVASEVYVYYGY
ncbi:chitobiase/beta-hexosaminidase C-terminal domain-containing protein [Blautia sp. An46]|uniref:chitobiase/beta-hexosaminidase C-terminal domain-containing protein n=1 Tax=Blautia sp. An46 TaxID=1965636 RepID=UPI000B3834FD|nr:chitobiase/beta-hexosaminidase C-terminal domain-containing protein [Blautia sp. An46]OUN90798.1 hypothetical protein B5G00_14965 [Blautia sp. An46]